MVYAKWQQGSLSIGYLRKTVGVQVSDVFRRHSLDGHAKHFARELSKQASLRAGKDFRVGGSLLLQRQ